MDGRKDDRLSVKQPDKGQEEMNEETDTVKKIRMRTNGKDEEDTVPVYLISLVEHKSRVDYNVSMQLLRYMVCIWNEYGKELRGKDEELQRALAREAENRIKLVIDTLRELDLPKEQITAMLMKKCGLDREEAAKRVEL